MILKAPRTAAIKIDGTLDDAGWKKAFRVPDMNLLSGNKPEVPTDIYLARDDQYLYVGFRSIEPDVTKISRQHKQRDMYTWRDDSVEIFYDGKNDHNSRRHLMFNAINGVTDIAIEGKKSDIKWNCPGLKHAATIGKGMWCCEVAIPLKEFSSPVIGINFMRNRNHLLSHASLVPDAHNQKFYAKLYLEDSPLKLAPVATPLLGRNFIAFEAGPGAAVTVTAEGRKQYAASVKGSVQLPVDLAQEGSNSYTVTARPLAGAKKPFVWHFTDTLPKALVIGKTADYYFASERSINIKGNINMNLVKGDGTCLKATITNAAGKSIFTSQTTVTGNDLLFTIPLERLVPEEKYSVEFTLLIKGKQAGSVKRSFYLMKAM